MFTKEDTKMLVESLNTGTALNEEEMEILAEECFKKLSASFDECSKKAYDKAVSDTKEAFKKERVKAFKRGKDVANECSSKAISEAEANGYAAGREAGLNEAIEEEGDGVEELLSEIKGLCQDFDLALDVSEDIVKKNTEQQMQESFRDVIGDFIDKKINESFPPKVVIDYDRMNVLENICESFKKTLCINDREVSQVVESTKNEIMQEFDEAKEALKAQTQRRIQAEQMLESVKAENLLLKKVSKLPVNEQKALMESFKGASAATINESFDKEYQKLQRSHHSKISVKPVVNDVICENVQMAKHEKMRKTAETAQRINESAEMVQKTPSQSRMDAYAAACKFINY